MEEAGRKEGSSQSRQLLSTETRRRGRLTGELEKGVEKRTEIDKRAVPNSPVPRFGLSGGSGAARMLGYRSWLGPDLKDLLWRKTSQRS